MTNSNRRINIHNSRDEWTLVIIAITLPLVSLLSISV